MCLQRHLSNIKKKYFLGYRSRTRTPNPNPNPITDRNPNANRKNKRIQNDTLIKFNIELSKG